MKVSDVYGSKNSISAKDLQGQRVTVTIENVTFKKFDDGSKLIATFKGKEKALILNKTNSNMIAEIAKSDESDDWIGVRIVLMPAKTDYQGKRVDCVRVDYPEVNGHAPAQRPKPKPLPPPIESEETYVDVDEPPF